MKIRKTITHIFALAIGLVLLMGCSAGKNYTRPAVDVPASYVADSVSDTATVVLSWREFFGDTVLLGLIDRALERNFDLKLAAQRIEIAQSYFKQSRKAWLPSVNLQATASTSNPSQNSLNGISLENFLGVSHIEDYTLAANLSWEIDVWGKIRNQKEAAMGDYLATFEAGRAIQSSIVAGVATSYYNLLMLETQLEIAERNVRLSDRTVSILDLQKRSGDVTELAVQQAIAQRQDAELLVPQLKEAIALEENALRMLMGDMPGNVQRLGRLDDNLPALATLWPGVPANLLRHRPDVRSQEHALKSANARVGVAQANFYPSLVLTGTGGLNAVKATDWFTVPASLFGTAAGTLLTPVFNRRALKTQFEVAKLEREQEVTRFRQSVTQAVHEVTNALIKIGRLEEQQQVAEERNDTMLQAVSNAQMLFRSGMANYLEVVTAQSRALQAELDNASIRRNQLSARIELYRALGGGWN